MQVPSKADHTLTVIAFNQPRHRSRFQRRDVDELGFLSSTFHDGQTSQCINALNSVLWQLNLNLKSLSRGWIPPIIGLRETRRGGCGNNGTYDIRHREAKLPGTLPIDVDVHRRIVELLGILQVAEEGQLGQLVL